MLPYACVASPNNHIWSTRMDGNDFDYAQSVAFDRTGRMAVAGSYGSTQLLIYSSNGRIATILPDNGTQGAFVSVFAPDGNHLWSARMNGNGNDVAWSVAFDLGGRLAVAGQYPSTQLLIYHSNGQVAAILPRNGSSYSAFVSVFASDGNHLWATRIDGDSDNYGFSVVFDPSGRLAVAGEFWSSQLLIYHSNGQFAASLPRNGSSGAFVSVFASDGNHLWSARMDGNGNDVAWSVAFDLGGRLAVAGQYTSTQMLIYHSNGQVAAMLPRNGSFSAAFVSVFASDGNHLWSTRMDGNGNDYAYSVALGSSGRLAVAGEYWSAQLLVYHSNGQLAATLPRNGTSGAFVSLFDVDVGSQVTTQNAAKAQFTFQFGYDGNSATTSTALPNLFVPSNSPFPVWVIIVVAGFALIGIAVILLVVKARRSRKNISVQPQAQTITTTDIEMTTTGMTTLQVTTHELSIPAYLEFKFGESFIQDKFIAKGGGGSIYICQSLLTDLGRYEPIVVKNLGMSVDRLSQQLAAAFWQEIAIMWKFRNHDMFCKVAGYSTDPACLIMRHYQMGDLRHFMLSHNAKFPYNKLLITDLMLQYCKGIAIMHSCEIVHCDIKPANCLLEENDGKLRLIIADFGISRIVSTSVLQVKAFVASALKGASVVYAAPEVMLRYRGQYVPNFPAMSKAGDLFALAVTMLELIQRKEAW
jgi:hypothetical protein